MTSPMRAPEIVDDERREPSVSQGSMRSADGAPLPLERTEVEAVVTGPVADVVVRQRFKNDRDVAIEAVYLFPLPAEASVHRLRFRIEDRVIDGVVKERAQARRDYEAALAQGRAATLVEEDKPALFTLSVANIAPGASIEVELAYQDLLPFDEGRWKLVYPMVAPQRYRDPAPVAQGAVAPPRALEENRSSDVFVTVRYPEATPVHELRCATHLVGIDQHPDGGMRVRLRTDGSVANKDFELDWKAAEEGVRPWLFFERKPGARGTFLLALTPSTPKPTTERGGSAGEMQSVKCGNCGGAITDLSQIREIPGLGPVLPCAYCGAVLAPGTDVITRPTRPRDVIVLVDRSASMRGAEALVAEAAQAVLSGLAPGDAVQVFAFDHERTALDGDGTRFLALSPELAAQVAKSLAANPPRGGSELEPALALSAKLPPREGRTRVVVLVSDVSVGNEGRLLRRLPELLGAGATLFVLGVGEGVDRRLVSRLARAGGGASEVLPPGPLARETMQRFARRVRDAGPVITDVTLWWEGSEMADLQPTPMPSLHSGEALRVLGHFNGTGPTKLVLTGSTASGKPYRQELSVTLPAESNQVPGLERAWARRRVEQLAGFADRERPDPATAIEGQRLALEWSIVSRWTSLVAEDRLVSVAKKRVRKGVLWLAGRAVFTLDGARRTIGRADEADVKVDHTNVSRLHAEIVFDGERFVVRDLASVNGTWIDGRNQREAVLSEGTRIGVGGEVFTFGYVLGEAPDAFFEFVPTQRAVDARSGEEGRRDAVVMEEDSLAMDDRGAPFTAAFAKGEAFEGGRASALGGALPALGLPPAPMPAMAAAPMVMPRSPSPMRSAPMAPPMAAPMGPPSGVGPGAPGGPPAFGAMPGGAPVVPYPAMPPAPRPPGDRHMVAGYAPPAPQGARPQATHAPVRSPGSEPYPEHELQWLSTRLRGELDLVILIDATGSMGPYIDEVRARLAELVEAVSASPLCKSLRVGIVAYRDHPPQERSFVTQVTPLTSDLDVIRSTLASLMASGGGDGPECVTDGLFDTVRLDWRASAAKAVAWFGDAPPHGVEPSNDAFPNGCPCGNHWFTQAESCREMGITIYVVGCLPTLRSYVGAEAMYRNVARTTRGMFLPLREARLLVPLIAGAAETALDGQRIDVFVETLLGHHGAMLVGVDHDERVRWITERFRTEGIRARAMDFAIETATQAPMRFRDVSATDVRASLTRLRSAGRTPW